MPLFVQLPPNVCKEIRHEGKSVYYRDFCSKYTIGKIPEKPSISYTAVIQHKTKKPLSDHFSTFPIDHSRNSLQHAIRKNRGNIETTYLSKKDHSKDNISEALVNIKAAWIKDVGTDKRQRGYTYGIAGKKMAVHHKQLVKKESVPGLKDWLDTSDEYEKRVVHNFLTNITKAGEQTTPSPPHVDDAPKTVQIHSPPKSAQPLLTRRSTPKASIEPQVRSMEECSVINPDESSSRASSRNSTKTHDSTMDVSTQVPLELDTKPNSSARKHRRCQTAPELHHSCQNCEACKQKIYKRMLQDLETRTHPTTTYDDLHLEKSKEPKQECRYIYRPAEDYTHCGTSFQRVNGRQKGYFIIHPDFVSENQSMAWKKWKVNNKKHLGESKSIL